MLRLRDIGFNITPRLLWLTVAGCLCASILRLVYLAYFHPLSKYPGPKLWAISRLPWAHRVIKGDVWHALDRFHDEYGPVVRIAPDELTYIDADAWRDIYGLKPALLKDPYSMTPPMNHADSLFTAEGDNHRRIRGAFVHAFSDKALREQSSIVEQYASQLMQRLRAGTDGKTVDLQPLFGYATFDIISDLTWGESPQSLVTPGSHDWSRRFFLHAKFSTVRNCLSRFYGMHKVLHYVFLRVTAKQRAENTRLTFERIDRRLAQGHEGGRSDFMTPIVGKISEDGRKGTITKSEVLTNGVAAVIAGSQLSTIAITTATFLMLRHGGLHWRRLVEEVRGSGFTCESDIGVASTQALPYLKAVINEAMRIHHPTPGSLPRVAPKGGIVVAGRHVPAGTVVGVSLYNMHTRPENFHRPLDFHPQRFLTRDDARFDPAFAGDRLDAFQPFSTGARNCIGSKLFLGEARVILARLAWAFDLELDEPHWETWLHQKAWLVCEPTPMRVKVSLVNREVTNPAEVDYAGLASNATVEVAA